MALIRLNLKSTDTGLRIQFDKSANLQLFEKIANNHPGDFSSDAQFFVFTGVIAWLGATACLVIYVFFSQRYLDDDKKAPLIVSKLKNFKKLCQEKVN